ncbi:MAG: pilus assembly protein, partial [Gammaproteobacteria bacterium]
YTDVRPQMGDPLHAEPALVQYGETAGVPDLTAFVATNDGYLHAFDVTDGEELFAFIPQELLPNLKTAMEDAGGRKLYGLDGSVVAWINDADGDGAISGAGEHVYLYFGMRRGGNNIYALDVTSKAAPKLMWVIKGGTGAYTELGETWSTINVEKIKDGGIEKTVLIFGGGYDTAQDGVSVRSADTVGRTIYIADAETGERLWTAGADSASPTDFMDYSIPARIKPLDISGDGFIDRLYAADMGGQIFRFDINNDSGSALSSSITGGRIVDIAGSATEDARRFYYPPDVALINTPESKYHALVIASGYRAHPLNEVIHDRIYMIKDRKTGSATTYSTLTEADLFDVTANLAGGDSGAVGDAVADADREAELANISGAEGWYIDLDDEDNPDAWIGEKGLAEALIIEGVAILTTYTPNITAPTNSCEPNLGVGKVFFLDMVDGTPAFPSNLDIRKDRHVELARSGIPPTPNVIITKGGEPTLCVG